MILFELITTESTILVNGPKTGPLAFGWQDGFSITQLHPQLLAEARFHHLTTCTFVFTKAAYALRFLRYIKSRGEAMHVRTIRLDVRDVDLGAFASWNTVFGLLVTQFKGLTKLQVHVFRVIRTNMRYTPVGPSYLDHPMGPCYIDNSPTSRSVLVASHPVPKSVGNELPHVEAWLARDFVQFLGKIEQLKTVELVGDCSVEWMDSIAVALATNNLRCEDDEVTVHGLRCPRDRAEDPERKPSVWRSVALTKDEAGVQQQLVLSDASKAVTPRVVLEEAY